MAAPTAPYPPPLSSPPTVESLELLLAGLRRPLQSGVPAPPVSDLGADLLFRDPPMPPPPPGASSPSPVTAPTDGPVPGPPGAGLSWSAHRLGHRRHRWWLVVAGGAVAVGGVAAAAGTGLL